MDRQVVQLHSRAETLATKFKQEGEANCINEALVFDREALALCPPGHPMRSVSLTCLATHLCTRYDQLGQMEDLNEAIILDREALVLRPPGYLDRSVSLNCLAVHLWVRYKRLGSPEDLSEAIVLDRDALALCPLGHPGRSKSLNSLAVHLHTRYDQLGSVEDLSETIVLDRDALALCPPGHPGRLNSLNNLAVHLCAWSMRFGPVEDLNEVIVLGREALALCPPGHSGRSTSLNNLAAHLGARHSQFGLADDLNEAIVLDKEALVLRPLGHPDRLASLLSLPHHLWNQFEKLGSSEDLDEAIVLAREALALCPLVHPNRSKSLNDLSIYLGVRYDYLGSVGDLNEAIGLNRDAIALRPPGHPYRSTSLNILAVHLFIRYQYLGSVEDLSEAIALDRDTLALRPLGHPGRSVTLGNLAFHLCTRYKHLQSVEDLDEAIILVQDALALRPPGHPGRSLSLNNVAVHLYARYELRGSVEDLNEAIVLDRDALALRPPGHPDRSVSLNKLAIHLYTRYKKLGSVEDLNEAIGLDRNALALCPLGHPNRSQSLSNLGQHLSTRFAHFSQSKDQEEVFSLYLQLADAPPSVSFDDLSAARAWVRAAEDFQHSTTLLAYKTSLQFLTHYLAALPSLPQHLTVLKHLTSSLAVDAFSASLRSSSLTDAVELLEQGRGVFWTQLTRLHSPIDDVTAFSPEGAVLAREFTHLNLLIRKVLDSSGQSQHDRVCDLNVQLQKVVTKIRGLTGLERFLLPPFFSDLQQAALQGPVIIVNASEFGCDALVVLYDHDPIHIPLSITKEGVEVLSSELTILTARAMSMNVTRDLCLILRELWNDAVSPIVDVLQKICPLQSRIWWCPTAEFSLLPLHATGPYKKGQQNLADLYISSYTPTLTALIRARRNHLFSPSKPKRFIAIGQANAAGESELFSVEGELAHIGRLVDGLATFTRIEGQNSAIERTTRELAENEWVHLACHGIPNQKEPFQSAFALHDGRLTIERIIRCEAEDPHFAYLSACHTTVGDEESPDEVIHLASAMQFVGFRSVVGTMWAVDDNSTNRITSMFYDNMKDESGYLDYTRAAFALNKTMKTLVDIPFDQRILYIHLGA